jgi:hypothetical protein
MGNFTLIPAMNLVFPSDSYSATYNYVSDPFGDNGKYIYYNMRFLFGEWFGTTRSSTVNFANHTIDGSVGFQGRDQTWTLTGDLTVTHTLWLQQTSYYLSSMTTFDANDFNITAYHINWLFPEGPQQTIYMGNGTWTITAPDPWFREWNIGWQGGGNSTIIYPEESQLILNIEKGAEATTSVLYYIPETQTPINLTINGVSLAGNGNDSMLLNGLGKTNNLIFNNCDGVDVRIVAHNTTNEISGSFVASGSSANRMILRGDTTYGGTYAIFSNLTGANITSLSYLTISRMQVSSSGSYKWYACNSIDNGNNTGWTWNCSRPHNYSFTLEGEAVETGVYTFGSYSKQYPKILDFTYPISQRIGTEFALSWVEIGSILIDGNDIYVAWQYSSEIGSSFGIDKLDYNNKLSGAYIETRVLSGNREQFGNFSKMVVSYAELPTGTNIVLQYSKDYGTTWTTMTTKKDVDRKLLYCEEEFEASSVAYRAVITAIGNDAPAIERADIVMR